MKNQQRGGTILGLIFGMVIGLAAALAVAIYVTKVPVPFLNKGATIPKEMRQRLSAIETGTPMRLCKAASLPRLRWLRHPVM